MKGTPPPRHGLGSDRIGGQTLTNRERKASLRAINRQIAAELAAARAAERLAAATTITVRAERQRAWRKAQAAVRSASAMTS